MPFKYEAYGEWPPRALLSGALPTPGRPARLHSESVVFPAARMALWRMPEKYSTQAHGGGGHTLPPPHPWAPLSPASASWGHRLHSKAALPLSIHFCINRQTFSVLTYTTLSDGLARGHYPILLNGWDPKKLVDFTGLLMGLALSK